VRAAANEHLLLVDEAPRQRLHVRGIAEVGKGCCLELECDRRQLGGEPLLGGVLERPLVVVSSTSALPGLRGIVGFRGSIDRQKAIAYMHGCTYTPAGAREPPPPDAGGAKGALS
jgi:hypothetical protein